MSKYIAYIEPMGAVRMTQAGKWTSESAKRYLSYKAAIGYDLKTQKAHLTDAACGVKLKFIMPMPKGWSLKKQIEHAGKHHTKKPDIDNLIKGVFDAANGIIWKDDNQVVHCEAEKVYGNRAHIEIEVTELF